MTMNARRGILLWITKSLRPNAVTPKFYANPPSTSVMNATWKHSRRKTTVDGENRPLVTDEPVVFEKEPVEIPRRQEN